MRQFVFFRRCHRYASGATVVVMSGNCHYLFFLIISIGYCKRESKESSSPFFVGFIVVVKEYKAFPPPFPLCHVLPLCELPVENNKHLSFEWRRGGGASIVSFPEVTPLGDNVSTILWPIVVLVGLKGN